MTAMKCRILTLVLVCCLFEKVDAQSSTPASKGGAAKTPATTTASGGKEDAKAAAPESERLKRLKALVFDRRPSAMLKAWSAPPAPLDNAKNLDEEIKGFAALVTMGRWPAVAQYLKKLPAAEAAAAYEQVLESLGSAPNEQASNPLTAQFPLLTEKQTLGPMDLVGLIDASPAPLKKEMLDKLGGILAVSLEAGAVVDPYLVELRGVLARPSSSIKQRDVALVLFAAGRAVEGGEFLPPLEQATQNVDRQALNLWATHELALHAKDTKPEHLTRAWEATMSAAQTGPLDDEHRQEALRRAVSLAPRLPEEQGRAWLQASFTAQPERGREILSAIGVQAAKGPAAHPTEPGPRRTALSLQRTAIEALLAASPNHAGQWQEQLTFLGMNWLREASLNYELEQVHVEQDNPYFIRQIASSGERRPVPLSEKDLLECRPSDAWLEQMDASLRPSFFKRIAQLHLRDKDEAPAFPFIERLAATQPDQAHDLAEEFLRTWITTHDPNERQENPRPYYFMYGFEWRKEAIPLTRSKQERNLVDLEQWVRRLRALPGKPVDEQLLAQAFTKCHSSAEVYRLDAIEKVLGGLETMKPDTLASMIQQMRANLAGVWRNPAVQQEQKTKRNPKEIEREVLRGYDLSRKVLARGLEIHPQNWSLLQASAALQHDQASYRRELEKTPGFSKSQSQAFEEFERAADVYRSKVADLPEGEHSTVLYEQWFYASLGACDLGQLSDTKAPDLTQPKKIRAALLALPDDKAEKHLEKFASLLFERIGTVKPAMKFRYLRSGFEIVGDHPKAREARKLFDYYNDLVTEVRLAVVPDGGSTVGQQPFGALVNLIHTREIERESGGFSRYLQNQNKMSFAFNYGRPTENYLDRFQEVVRDALNEQFEILSVTFSPENVRARSAETYGWRTTPYAYLLLKPRGPQVDKISSLRLDLDFMDTTGYAVIPLESPPVAIDASPRKGPPAALSKLEITQILDERQAADGRLMLEVKATALGLVPELADLLDLKPADFDIVDTKDEGVAVVRLDSENEQVAPFSQRNWQVQLKAKADLSRPPASFAFGKPKLESTTMVYQRYADADLVAVEPVTPLQSTYAQASLTRWVGGALALLLALGVGYAFLRRRREETVAGEESLLPAEITPFTVLGLLRQIDLKAPLAVREKGELAREIERLESHYFSEPQAQEPNLREIASLWTRKVPRNGSPAGL